MKYLLALFVAVAFFFANSSCKKCVTCSYTYPKDGLVGGPDTTIKYDEYCNKKNDVEIYEDHVKYTADSLRGSYSCQ